MIWANVQMRAFSLTFALCDLGRPDQIASHPHSVDGVAHANCVARISPVQWFQDLPRNTLFYLPGNRAPVPVAFPDFDSSSRRSWFSLTFRDSSLRNPPNTTSNNFSR